MLIFWLSLLFCGWWFDDNIYEYTRDCLCDYINSFDGYYFQDWKNSHSKTFIRLWLNEDFGEVVFKDEIDAGKVLGEELKKMLPGFKNVENMSNNELIDIFLDFINKTRK